MLSSYVDDFFGGPIRTGALQHDKQIASLLLENIIEIGDMTNTRVNLEKCSAPVRRLHILKSCLIQYKSRVRARKNYERL